MLTGKKHKSYADKERSIGKNGRIHIPAFVRVPLGIKEGDIFEFDFDAKEGTIKITSKITPE